MRITVAVPAMLGLAMPGLPMLGLPMLGLAACVYEPGSYPKSPRAPTSNRGIVPPGQTDRIPDTPYEVRKAEMDRDRQIAGRPENTYPPLFKNQKSEDDRNEGS